MSHMIELHRVSKFYTNKDTVSTGFSRVDLTLDMGEFVAITGESGSGKSTLLNVISGLDSYEEGEMFVAGEDTSAYRTEDYERYRKTYIGNIFQDFNLVNSYSVYQNIELSMLLCGKSKEERKQRINELIDLVDLRKYRRTKASRLSGGQKQRVAIARALAKDAPIIVADEPTGNLDSASAAKVMETLYKISRDKLVVIVTHNYEQAEPYVTRKITMHDGRVIEDKRLRPAATAPDYDADTFAKIEEADTYDALPGMMPGEGSTADSLDDIEQAIREMESGEVRPGSRTARHALENTKKESGSVKEASDSKRSRGGKGKASGSKRTGSGFRDITFGSQLRLGLRNTFNLPAKFILLLIVYMFVTTAVLGQYASTKQTMHMNSILGYNEYFTDTSAERLIVTKQDGGALEDSDYEAIAAVGNVDYIVRSDAGIDSGIMFESDNIDISGPMYPVSCFDEDKLSIGKMPEKDDEVVLALDPDSYSYDQIKDMGEKILGKKYYINASNSMTIMWGDHLVKEKLKVVGVAFLGEDNTKETNGSVFIYVSDRVANDILIKNAAANSKITLDYNGTKTDVNGYQVVFPAEQVDPGHAYISEEQAYQFFTDGAAKNKSLEIRAKNHYFDTTDKLTITGIFKESTINSMLGLNKEDYDSYTSYVYINPKDYRDLFDQGNFQSSVYMKDEKRSDDTVKSLEDMGLKVLVVKDTLSDVTGGFEFIINMFSIAMLIVEFIVLFFIAYAVIRLIMRSRNSYYSTLRILGANKKNTGNILRIELLTMMAISYGAVLGGLELVKRGILQVPEISERLTFLHPVDYVILFGALLIMSLLIANRYSRKIFSKSAMKAYREEV